MSQDKIDILQRALLREKAARKQAEKILEEKSSDLYYANKRLEVDLGYRNHKNYDAFKLSGIYQWIWNIDQGFNWYAGFGAGIGSWSYSNDINIDNDDGLFINADGNVGIEYNFNAPFLISLFVRSSINTFS